MSIIHLGMCLINLWWWSLWIRLVHMRLNRWCLLGLIIRLGVISDILLDIVILLCLHYQFHTLRVSIIAYSCVNKLYSFRFGCIMNW